MYLLKYTIKDGMKITGRRGLGDVFAKSRSFYAIQKTERTRVDLKEIDYRLLLHAQELASFGRNLALYSPIGAWLVMSLVALAHMEFEVPMVLSHPPLFVYVGRMI